jgi:dTDP-4-amino-4,6-dideoxygalactose transaminase
MYKELPSARRDNLRQATLAAEQVLCLPIYPDLESEVVEEICDIIAGR